MNTAEQKMLAARTSLVLEKPFYGSLSLHIILKEDTGCKTAWIDGKYLGYNPEFVNGLSHSQLVALFEHEISHVAYGHPWRRDNRDKKQWNIATDKSINAILRENGSTLPPDACYAEGDEIGKSAEWIYAHVQQNESEKPEQGNQPSDDDGGQEGPSEAQESGNDDSLGECRDAPTSSDSEGDAPTEEEWQQRTISAMVQAKAMGKLPASMERAVKDALKTKVDTRSLLLRFFSERCMSDYSWSTPNRRYISQGLYLPALESKTLGNVAIFTDTSGSMDDVALSHARSIVESVISEVNPQSITVYFCDAEVTGIHRFEQGEPLVWQPKGGGGTSFVPVLKAIEDEGEAVCALCISDLDGTFPESCSIPTVWLATPTWSGRTLEAPFGETIPVEF